MSGALRYRREHHVRRGADFLRAFKSGARRDAGWCVVHGAANGLPFPRLGLSVGRRCGKAVRRNRIKRVLREAFRLSMAALPAGVDLVVAVRLPPDADRSRPGLDEAMELFQRAAPSLARRLLSPGGDSAAPAPGPSPSLPTDGSGGGGGS